MNRAFRQATDLISPSAEHGGPQLRRIDGDPVRVPIVEDEAWMTDLLLTALRYEGWDVRNASDGTTGVRLARTLQPDVVVLDIMLPHIDGLEVWHRLRAESPELPVLFLTARDSLPDRVAGLNAGGDDYVAKPFSLEELVARLRRLMYRTRTVTASAGNTLVVGELTLDEDTREVHRGGELIPLTTTGFELLRFLTRNLRRVVSKVQILHRVWNYDFGGRTNIVELYISRLRKKIDASREPMIHAVRGAGYVLRRAE